MVAGHAEDAAGVAVSIDAECPYRASKKHCGAMGSALSRVSAILCTKVVLDRLPTADLVVHHTVSLAGVWAVCTALECSRAFPHQAHTSRYT